jgi:hypothetical protein
MMKTFEQFISEANSQHFASARNLKDAERHTRNPESRALPGISSKRRASMEQERATRLATSPTGTTVSDNLKAALAAKVEAQKRQTDTKPVQPIQRKQLELSFMKYPQYLGASKPKLPKLNKPAKKTKTKAPGTKQLRLRGV